MWELNEFTEETAYYIREIPPATDMGNTSHPITLVFRMLNFNLEMSRKKTEVGIYKRKQESKNSTKKATKKRRKQELDQENDQENKKTRTRPRKRPRKKEKTFFFS